MNPLILSARIVTSPTQDQNLSALPWQQNECYTIHPFQMLLFKPAQMARTLQIQWKEKRQTIGI